MQKKYNPLTVLPKPNFSKISRLPILKANIVLYYFTSLTLGILITYFLDKRETYN